jgi:hypothetical protein
LTPQRLTAATDATPISDEKGSAISYDINVYVPDADPPAAEIRQVLDMLGLPHGEKDPATFWWINAGTSVHITVWPSHTHRRADTYPWKVSVSTNGLGRAREAWSVQFAVPYLLLACLPDAMVEDPQTNSCFTDADSFLAGHRIRLGSLPAVSELRMVEAGLLEAGFLGS